MIASVPDLPRFDLRFGFTIIHGFDSVYYCEHEVDIGGEEPNCQNNALDYPFERSTTFSDSRPLCDGNYSS